MDFREVETKFKELKRKYDAGIISEEEFKAQLKELMIQDEEGRWWIIGYETGRWYYHDGEKWVQSDPPKPAPLTPLTPVEELQRVRKLFREKGLWLYLLPTVVAGAIWWFVSSVVLEGYLYYWRGGFDALLAVAAAFLAWLVLRTRVTRWWQMLPALAGSWVVAGWCGAIWDAIVFGDTFPGPDLVIDVAVIFALGFGFSVLFAKALGPRLSMGP